VHGLFRAFTELFAELFRGQVAHFVYISSAGVYCTSEQWPLSETSPLDPQSRHKGKAETDIYLLADPELRATSLRPVYIYGPRNYNDIEAWFFDRLLRDRPVLIPGDGQTITQLGHGRDLARAGLAILGNAKALGQVYNLSGAEYITFTGLALACAQACGKEAQLVYFDSAKYAHLGRKFFPLRQQHFFSSIAKAERDLSWTPQFSLAQGLADSLSWYQSIGRHETTVDFSADDALLAAFDG